MHCTSLPVTLLLNAFLVPFDGAGYEHKSLVLGQHICQHFPQWFVLPRVKYESAWKIKKENREEEGCDEKQQPPPGGGFTLNRASTSAVHRPCLHWHLGKGA